MPKKSTGQKIYRLLTMLTWVTQLQTMRMYFQYPNFRFLLIPAQGPEVQKVCTVVGRQFEAVE